MNERRKYTRLPLALSLEVCSDTTKSYLARGFITNLSEGGVALETPKNLRPGAKLLFRFTLPNERTFSLLSEIMYSRDGILSRAYGARFCDVNSDAGAELKQYVAAHAE
jgi:hypothetical protein